MDFGLDQQPYIQIDDIEFKTKQKIHIENMAICKSADPTTKIRITSGDFYIAHPRITRGFIRVAASEANCDKRIIEGYISILELIKQNKELTKHE